MGPSKTSKQRLTQFSMWLKYFDSSNYQDDIELPGQYSGSKEPNINRHIKISSFDESLLVMGSMRRPKRLKMRGNDEKDYPYLIKGGEDLRLDQRVEQLFGVMNQIFKKTPATSKRKLRIHTYQVIPMTNKVGIIEWLNNTKPLKAIVEEELEKRGGKGAHILKLPAAKMHDQWLKQYEKRAKQKVTSVSEYYYLMFKSATRKETMYKMNKQYESVPWDILRAGVLSLSRSPEAYLQIREHFARTLAVFSIGSYIIGIGDRHLDNFLLDLSNGGVIGIDFGHAFGSATQFLPIPELIPFRLTMQLQNFLKPLDSQGLLKHDMVHALSALQGGKEILLGTMDVFIKEPLLDWEKLARKLAAAQGSRGKQEKTWFPKKKIQIARRKLECYNPAFVTMAELKDSVHQKRSYLNNVLNIVYGDKKHNIRAQTGEICPSVKRQVDCLVDQATDDNILGRTWGGWASWI
eukprot:CAMPEP_0168535906 /NCGR_PEP_ID=MMETSP0405-20121227/19121_1 /TAXON_ID=498012 /ORGANISM="Trichosphaerium sp, Strain Am-I-7 wt" /LENGTH=462 /DNA_ID=CAMNT_0008563587 /DNA_START=274 /DNA_END=1662 /DNA_ORIENTATION=+